MTGRLPARIDDLPTSLVDVAEVLGLRVALAMIQNFGGLEVTFPVRPGPDHAIIKALGETDGYALCSFLAGQKIYVPHNRVTSARADVVKLRAAGKTRAEISRLLGISERHVSRVSNGAETETDHRQQNLFD